MAPFDSIAEAGTASTLADRALELATRRVSAVPQYHRRRRARDDAAPWPARAARNLRSAQRDAGIRLGDPARVESPRRLDSHRRRSQAGRRRPACAARDELLGAGPCAHDVAGTATAPAHPAGASGPHPVSHQLLPRSMGLLRGPAGTRYLAGRRVRGRHRLDVGARQPDLRRVLSYRAPRLRKYWFTRTPAIPRSPTTTQSAWQWRRYWPGKSGNRGRI